jgi:hypothetical protein
MAAIRMAEDLKWCLQTSKIKEKKCIVSSLNYLKSNFISL